MGLRVSVTMAVLRDFASGYVISTVEKHRNGGCMCVSFDDCLFEFEYEIEYAYMVLIVSFL